MALNMATDADMVRLAGQLDAFADLLRREAVCDCKTGRTIDGEWVATRACHTKAEHAMRVARQAAGFVGQRGDGRRDSNTPNPVLAALMNLYRVNPDASGSWRPHEGPEWWHEQMSRDIALASGALADLFLLVAELGKVTRTNPTDLTKTGQGLCPCCDHFCSGAHNDRLRSGMCDTDYRAWRRAGSTDRYAFIRTRRNERGLAS